MEVSQTFILEYLTTSNPNTQKDVQVIDLTIDSKHDNENKDAVSNEILELDEFDYYIDFKNRISSILNNDYYRYKRIYKNDMNQLVFVNFKPSLSLCNTNDEQNVCLEWLYEEIDSCSIDCLFKCVLIVKSIKSLNTFDMDQVGYVETKLHEFILIWLRIKNRDKKYDLIFIWSLRYSNYITNADLKTMIIILLRGINKKSHKEYIDELAILRRYQINKTIYYRLVKPCLLNVFPKMTRINKKWVVE